MNGACFPLSHKDTTWSLLHPLYLVLHSRNAVVELRIPSDRAPRDVIEMGSGNDTISRTTAFEKG
jgi:hypothetical protein